ncbi:DUF5954 family protein [Actinomadura rayongensis]|uniref:PE-PGRS family protein n=1 Tax=Actinomadura rayongensis TaxID=1429076 RepID=A0A6I4W6M9_9ACTN|nr:DUF5954 family protein [Actinomadura rayongensis]MXQ63925.1 hypothetical protein [Actinomadura rayongensis]
MTTGDGDAGGRLFPDDLDRLDPVGAVRFADACRSAVAYPDLVAVGPLFAPAERTGDGWRIVGACDPLPGGAREVLADVLADRAALLGLSYEEATAYLAAARHLRAAPDDEIGAAGSRFRVVRVEQFVRTGQDGPEPPRPSDPDPRPEVFPVPPARPWDVLRDDPGADDLRGPLLAALSRAGREPSRAYRTPVPLSPMFTVAERRADRWHPSGRLHDLPGGARTALATYFRHVVPAIEAPDPTARAEYAYAAALLDDGSRRNGVEAAGRRFRIVRIERVALAGPDGPEPPRPADARMR